MLATHAKPAPQTIAELERARDSARQRLVTIVETTSRNARSAAQHSEYVAAYAALTDIAWRLVDARHTAARIDRGSVRQ